MLPEQLPQPVNESTRSWRTPVVLVIAPLLALAGALPVCGARAAAQVQRADHVSQ